MLGQWADMQLGAHLFHIGTKCGKKSGVASDNVFRREARNPASKTLWEIMQAMGYGLFLSGVSVTPPFFSVGFEWGEWGTPLAKRKNEGPP